MWRPTVVILTLAGLLLRLHSLGDVPLRWDEGWSIALAALPSAEMVRLTALDVHPPLYYALLRAWLAIGSGHEVWTRTFSVFAGTAAIPLAAAATAAWWRRSGSAAAWAGLAAAGYVALAPALLYYSGVVRMYAMTTPLLLLAAWGLARLGDSRRISRGPEPGVKSSRRDGTGGPGEKVWWRGHLAALVGSTAALYTFYYCGFALAGLYAAALVVWPSRWKRLAAVAATTAVAYLPWLAAAAPEMSRRIGVRSDGFEATTVWALAGDGLCASLLCEPVGAIAVWIPLIVVTVGCAAARPILPRRLAIVVLPTLAVLIGVGVGAQAHMFAARYAIAATPFIAMGLGWAAAGLARRHIGLGIAAAIAVVAAALPSLTGFVYEKTAEVTDPYDPATDWRQLADYSEPGDTVVFNVLSLAGAYERYRTPDDPPWTYAQLWDPVHEQITLATDRMRRSVDSLRVRGPTAGRLWLVLYKGTAASDTEALKRWADSELYPSDGWWHDQTLYQGYVVTKPDAESDLGPEPTLFENGVELVSAAYQSAAAEGSSVAVALVWRAGTPPSRDASVFVHLYDQQGNLVAQHDAYPSANARPQSTWGPGELVADRHGLQLEKGVAGPLSLVVGLYDPWVDRRWLVESARSDALWEGPAGPDGVVLGTVEVVDRE